MSADPTEATRAGGDGAFPTTHWSMVVHAGAESSSTARSALESLCRQYWYPLYRFIRRQGRTHHEAEDTTQAFLARILATDSFSRARPDRGRFRSFLLSSLRNFQINEWHREHAAKRGGGAQFLPLEFKTAEHRYTLEPPDTGLTPEQAFDRTWAIDMITRSIAVLGAEYEKAGQRELFAAMRPLLWGDASNSGRAERLGMTQNAFNVACHRFRARLGERLRIEVAETVADRNEVDAELRHLIAALHNPAP